MADLPDDDLLISHIDHLLADGPIELSDLAEGVARSFPAFAVEGLVGEELELYVDELLFDTAGYWVRDRTLVGHLDALRVDSVSVVRITADDLESGSVAGEDVPLLTELFIPHRLDGAEGYNLEFSGDHERFSGPSGWLDGARPGDLVAIRFDGQRLSHDIITDDDLVDSPEVLDWLRGECERLSAVRRGEPDFVLSVELRMCGWDFEPRAFSVPMLPFSELLVAAGFELSGEEWGPAGEEWETFSSRAFDDRADELADEFGFGPCCDRALDRVRALVVDLAERDDLDTTLVPTDELEAVADAMLHSSVATVAGELLNRHLRYGPAFRRLGRLLGDDGGSATARAAGAFIEAFEAEATESGEVFHAAARRAVDLVPDFQAARELLALCLLDAGDLNGAIRLATDPFDPDVGPAVPMRRVRDEFEAPFRKVGRNDTCPCGSGRRFKQCCLRHPKRTPEQMVELLLLVLSLASQRPHRRTDYDLAEVVVDSGEMAGFIDPLEFVLFESGLLADHVERRRGQLSAELLALAESALASGRSLLRVVDAAPDEPLVVETLDGERQHRFDLGRTVQAGDLLLGCFCEIDDTLVAVGQVHKVDRDAESEILDGLAQEMVLGDRVRWLDDLVASTPVRDASGEPRVLITAVIQPDDREAFATWLGDARPVDGPASWSVDPRADHDRANPPTVYQAAEERYVFTTSTRSSKERFAQDLAEAGLEVEWGEATEIPITEGMMAEAARSRDDAEG